MDNEPSGGLYVNEEFPSIGILMYADDVAEAADLPIWLQRKLNNLERFCKQWAMEVNLSKSKIIVFRSGDYLRKYEKWFYRGAKVETVKHYNYLGLIFSSRLSWSPAKTNLATKSIKALFFNSNSH